MIEPHKDMEDSVAFKVRTDDPTSPDTDSKSSKFLKAMRLGVLLLLWVQISFSILVVDYSRNIKEEKYSNSDVVILSESVKLIISAIVIMFTGADNEISADHGIVTSYAVVRTNDRDSGDIDDIEADSLADQSMLTLSASSQQGATSSLVMTYYGLIRSSRKMFLIVVLYAISNIVALSAVEYLGSGVYNTVAQLKILTTASFGKVCLNREYSSAKWRALVT